jgi:hypothetical protein
LRLFTFWSFAPTTYIERLCLKSMLAAGHAVDLFTYDRNAILPEGVTVRDAVDIMPRDQVILHKNGSPALFSDMFRCEGLRRQLGTWIDADVILLRNISDLGAEIFGWQDDRNINGAILRLPPDSPYLTYVSRLVSARVPLPSHWPRRKKLKQLLRACVGRHRRLGQLDWGSIGPIALTIFARENDRLRVAQPSDVFYPIHWRDAAALFDPVVHIEDRFTTRTRAVHLWNFHIRDLKTRPPPPGSFIARMCERYGVEYDLAPHG